MESIIRLEHVFKNYGTKAEPMVALHDVNLSINRGEIYGIIGMSGAGKSTLVRCLNYLERPTSGDVYIEERALGNMKEKELRKTRQHIAMIFQHFNLLMQRNVVDNICFPLEIAGLSKQEARKKAKELLKVVGLEEKEEAYPAQLSGGQKQRVAIARALANDPKILLCDEATSALDPQTTKAILALLKKINKEFGITIVIITHEMAVVQEICTHVAIVDHGKIVETGEVSQIFASPKTKEARKLVYQQENCVPVMEGKRCIRIVFSENSSFEPVIGNMILECKSPVNILYANTQNINGIACGEMVLQLPEKEEVANRCINYLKERKLTVEEAWNYVE